jgi:histidinol-phosphate aminotransferase
VRLAKLAEDRLRGVPGYAPARRSPGPAPGKLSSNEAPLGPPPAVRAAVATAARELERYPDEASARQALAADAGVDASRLLLTNGSDELCYLIASVFLGPGRTAVIGDPCYQIDATASLLAGATLRRVPLRDGRHDIAAMAGAAQDASVLWLPSPHNPTGAAVTPRELDDLLARVPQDCLVVLDEAYRAFLDPGQRPDAGGLLAAHPNVLIQRTLSKDWALAGLRAGYGLAPAEIIAALARARPPFSVNALALAAIEAGAGASAWREMAVARVREERSRLQAELSRLGIEHYPSQASFVTARLDPALVAPALARSGLVVRSGDDLGMPGWVRISVGWAPQMAQLRGVLGRLNAGTRPADAATRQRREGDEDA